MDWDDLRAFLALARARRLEGAGRLLGQNATTVARRIKRLEAALQATLFEQTAAGHALTATGQRLLPRAEGMESLALEAQAGAGAADALSGSIRLSASEGFGSQVLAPALPRFVASYPRVQVELVASTGFLNPSRREADIAIMLARPKSGPLTVSRLTDYALGLYASPAYLTEAGTPARVPDLGRHRLVGYVPDLIYAPELQYLREIDADLSPAIQSSSINAQAQLVANGAGLGVLPCFIGDAMPGLVRVLAEAVDLRRSFWLVVHRDVRRLVRISRFVDWLHAEIAAARALMLGRLPDR
ncbi:LysR family transcriptional regulator [Sphingomonas sp.]|uniref:LysR family transcriptional regulator n=1 Tax=Sphingomonas sp. TaxID=28214 RepID=UPI0035C7C99E